MNDHSDRDHVYEPLTPPAALTRPQRLPWSTRIYRHAAVRSLVIMLGLLALWQGYARWLDNPLMLPSVDDVFTALASGLTQGSMLPRIGNSLAMLLLGYAAGIAATAILVALAMTSRLGRDLLRILIAFFSPLPAIALLPLAMLWLGLGPASMIFVLVHAVLWPLALNTLAGFDGVSSTLRMVGRNYGLRGPRYVCKILIPAAFPHLLTGLRVSWAFAWRTLIAAELVFGVSAGSGGLGWYIYENKNLLEIPAVFAGLLAVILIGYAVETLIFRVVEARTVRRWGMQL